VTQVDRATSETLRAKAAQEGLVPLKAWVKSALGRVVQVCLKQTIFWIGDDAVDPMHQPRTSSSLGDASIK
jgi:hypothetical protein